MYTILRDFGFSFIVEDRIVFVLWWLVNEYPWSYTFSLMIVYFRENDRLVSNLTIVCFSRFQTLNRKIVFFPKYDSFSLRIVYFQPRWNTCTSRVTPFLQWWQSVSHRIPAPKSAYTLNVWNITFAMYASW